MHLAKRDPSNNATTGITRTKTNKSGFTHDDAVKSGGFGGIDAWPSDKYFNIWVCNLEGGFAGYAQFPGGPRQTDGVVINYTAFCTTANPPYNRGKTAVHEIGHCMNLLHIWGDDNGGCDGSDNVVDTANQASENYGNRYMFTVGQVKRMDATLNGPRASILFSDGLIPPGTEDADDLLTLNIIMIKIKF